MSRSGDHLASHMSQSELRQNFELDVSVQDLLGYLLQHTPSSSQMVDLTALLSALQKAASKLLCLEPQPGRRQPIRHDNCNPYIQQVPFPAPQVNLYLPRA